MIAEIGCRSWSPLNGRGTVDLGVVMRMGVPVIMVVVIMRVLLIRLTAMR